MCGPPIRFPVDVYVASFAITRRFAASGRAWREAVTPPDHQYVSCHGLPPATPSHSRTIHVLPKPPTQARRDVRVPALLGAVAFLLAFAQRPGWATADTKINLHVDPGRFLATWPRCGPRPGSSGTSRPDSKPATCSRWGRSSPSGTRSGFLTGSFSGCGSAPCWRWPPRAWPGSSPCCSTGRSASAQLAAGAVVAPQPVRRHLRQPHHRDAPRLRGAAVADARRPPRPARAPRLAVAGRRRAARHRLGRRGQRRGDRVDAARAGAAAALRVRPRAWSPLRQVLRSAARAVPLTALASLWWVVPACVQSSYGIDFLHFTEQPGTVWGTTSATESLRLMSFWLSYVGIGFAGRAIPYFDDSPHAAVLAYRSWWRRCCCPPPRWAASCGRAAGATARSSWASRSSPCWSCRPGSPRARRCATA